MAREGNVSEEWSDDLANTPLSEAWVYELMASMFHLSPTDSSQRRYVQAYRIGSVIVWASDACCKGSI